MKETDKKIGFLINPVAGLGGRAGMKGSDDAARCRKALLAGYEKSAFCRAEECLKELKGLSMDGWRIYAPEGCMGADVLFKVGIPCEPLENSRTGSLDEETSREDTLYFARRLCGMGMDLILFCGGDGTARDICEAAGSNVPVLGVPAGVKMYSACFATTPCKAGEILKRFIQGKETSFSHREVMDLDENSLDELSVSPTLYGFLTVPDDKVRLQRAKEAGTSEEEEAEVLAAEIRAEMKEDTLYILGPGSTTYRVKQMLHGTGTVRGVDLAKNGRILRADADERTILSFLDREQKAEIIVTCIGGNGFLFGRGNQQISPLVLKKVGKSHIRLAVTREKLSGLGTRPMLVDTGDLETDRYLAGYYKIRLNAKEEIIYRVQAGADALLS